MKNPSLIIGSYENPLASGGGISPVVHFLSFSLGQKRDIQVWTPYHSELMQEQTDLQLVYSMEIVFSLTPHHVKIWKKTLTWQGKTVIYYYFQSSGPVFKAKKTPYNTPDLIRDACFFGKCMKEAYRFFFKDNRIPFLLNDWQAATTALAFSREEKKPAFWLLMHNCYDSNRMLSSSELRDLGVKRKKGSALQLAVPMVQQPLLTVNEIYARELQTDPVQTEILAPHLQSEIQGSDIKGISHASFIPPEALFPLDNANDFFILKQRYRKEFLQNMSHHVQEGKILGDSSILTKSRAPLIMMGGRAVIQKGQDIAVAAAEKLLKQGSPLHFLFFPIMENSLEQDIPSLALLAEKYPENIHVILFKNYELYLSALRASSWVLFPSIYEPYGSPSEAYINGTPCIARATGGLVSQIIPRRDNMLSWHEEIEKIRESVPTDEANGILFYEKEAVTTEEWRQYMTTGQNEAVSHKLSEELVKALHDGVNLFTENREVYYRLVCSGLRRVASRSWEQVADEYEKVIFNT